MARSGRGDGPGLFDLPLTGPAQPEPEPPEADRPPSERPQAEPPPSDRPQAEHQRAEPQKAEPRQRGRGALPLFDDESEDVERAGSQRAPRASSPRPVPVAEPPVEREPEREPEPAQPPEAARADAADWRRATAGRRLVAGVTDLLLIAATGLLLVLGSLLLGVRTGAGQTMPLVLFLLLFSLVYTVVPLAFWGHTPGMLRARLVARSHESEPLTFGQTGLRWAGMVLTTLLLGLPLLLTLHGGRSLTDRLSRSETYQAPL